MSFTDIVLGPHTTAFLQARFACATEAVTLASLSGEGISLLERVRASKSFEPTEEAGACIYELMDGNWWQHIRMKDSEELLVPAPFPGADLELAGLFRELIQIDALIDGTYEQKTVIRITEDISPVVEGETHRVMVMHQDRPEFITGPERERSTSYHVQDRFEHLTTEWLRDYCGERDSAYPHMRRLFERARAIRQTGTPLAKKADTGDDAYSAWYSSPATQLRLWRALPLTVVRAPVAAPHAGRPHEGSPVMRVFSRMVVYRPKQAG